MALILSKVKHFPQIPRKRQDDEHTIWHIQAIRYEAFTHLEGQKQFVQMDRNDLFPYLLVNIGSGVSMIKVLLAWCNSFRLYRSYV